MYFIVLRKGIFLKPFRGQLRKRKFTYAKGDGPTVGSSEVAQLEALVQTAIHGHPSLMPSREVLPNYGARTPEAPILPPRIVSLGGLKPPVTS
jgi:hypothetical protein